MSTQLAFVLVTLIICVTVIVICIFCDDNKEIKRAHERAEYWKGRYNALATVLDKGAEVELRAEVIEYLEELGVKLKEK